MKPASRAWAVLVLPALLLNCRPAPAAPLRVAAAADLTETLTELGARFEAATQRKVIFSFGSSGLLAKQLVEGAPFDVFLSANVALVDQTVAAGACDGSTVQRYAKGQLAAWSASAPLPSLEALLQESNRRIALGNPEHAPYGQAAQQALEAAGLWSRLKARLVFAENVRQALQFAETGNAEIALVAYSNVIGKTNGSTLLVDPRLYAPIQQALVVCKRGAQPEAVRRFVAYLQTVEARAVLQRNGFQVDP